MPVYNTEKYLKETFEGIINQTFEDFELIVINDGSTDSSYNIISEYEKKDNRVKVISRENRGIVYSLNEGIDLSCGTYIARIDSDDVCILNRFELQINFLENNQDYGLVCSTMLVIDEFSKEIKKLWKDDDMYLAQEELFYQFFFGNAICQSSVIFRKDIFKMVGGYSNKFSVSEDYFLWSKIILISKIHKFREPLVKWRLHKSSVSFNKEGANSIRSNDSEIRKIYFNNIFLSFPDEYLEAILNSTYSRFSFFDYQKIKKNLAHFKKKLILLVPKHIDKEVLLIAIDKKNKMYLRRIFYLKLKHQFKNLFRLD
jgi:glycosyltransferase involved in cell wall biosynthesis